MKKITVTLLLAFTALTARVAQADQCQWNGRYQAQTARSIMVNNDMIVSYCEKCTDKTMKAHFPQSDNSGTKDGKNIHFRDQGTFQGTRYWEFTVNEGTPLATTLDLAYTYVVKGEGKNRVMVNVGSLVYGCSPQGVSEVLPWDASKVTCVSQDGSCG